VLAGRVEHVRFVAGFDAVAAGTVDGAHRAGLVCEAVDRKLCGAPSLKATDHVAHRAEREALEGGGGEAGLVALVADQYELRVSTGESRVAIGAG
jgi:hypothetical protein